jgi:hypothetical protein
MRTIGYLIAVTALAAAIPAAVSAQAGRVKVGTLTCDVSPGVGLVLGSQREIRCGFTPSAGRRREVYVGAITRLGLDIGATSGGRLVWAVYAPGSTSPGALAGSYGGASAEGTVGAGLGANALIGGSNRTVALQPLSVQGQTGLNLAVGIAGLELRPARR